MGLTYTNSPKLPGLKKRLAGAILFTLFWCGITGLFCNSTLAGILKHQYAKQHFVAASGTILSSQFKTYMGSRGGMTYSPQIRYRYAVAGSQYTGDTYDFAGGSSSDSSYANKAVRENRPGQAVTVYYNPANPAEAILHLEVPARSYFMLLFLQPFALVGLELIVLCISLPSTYRSIQRFLDSDSSVLPWPIPRWGVMRQDFHGLAISSPPTLRAVLQHLLVAYGLASFFAIFVVTIFFHGIGDADPRAVAWAFVIAAAIGVLAMIRKAVRGGGSSRVLIDPVSRQLVVHSRKRHIETPLGQITALTLREIPYPRGARINNRTTRGLLLEAATATGEAVPIHAFMTQSPLEAEIRVIALKAQQELAGLLKVQAAGEIFPAASASGGQGIGTWRGSDSYNDLA